MFRWPINPKLLHFQMEWKGNPLPRSNAPTIIFQVTYEVVALFVVLLLLIVNEKRVGMTAIVHARLVE